MGVYDFCNQKQKNKNKFLVSDGDTVFLLGTNEKKRQFKGYTNTHSSNFMLNNILQDTPLAMMFLSQLGTMKEKREEMSLLLASS